MGRLAKVGGELTWLCPLLFLDAIIAGGAPAMTTNIARAIARASDVSCFVGCLVFQAIAILPILEFFLHCYLQVLTHALCYSWMAYIRCTTSHYAYWRYFNQMPPMTVQMTAAKPLLLYSLMNSNICSLPLIGLWCSDIHFTKPLCFVISVGSVAGLSYGAVPQWLLETLIVLEALWPTFGKRTRAAMKAQPVRRRLTKKSPPWPMIELSLEHLPYDFLRYELLRNRANAHFGARALIGLLRGIRICTCTQRCMRTWLEQHRETILGEAPETKEVDLNGLRPYEDYRGNFMKTLLVIGLWWPSCGRNIT